MSQADPPYESSVVVGDRAIQVVVGAVDADLRVDKFLRKLLPGATLGFIFKAIDRGKVRVAGGRVKPGYRLGAGDEIALPFGERMWADLTRSRRRPQPAGDGPLDIIYEDEAVLAIDKPEGVASHGGRDSIAAAVKGYLAAEAAPSLVFKVAPAHRLDRGTSGVLVFGKSPAAQRRLVAAFRERLALKRYVALVPAGLAASGRLSNRLAPAPGAPARRMIDVAEGQLAETEYETIAEDGRFQLLDLRPLTGRTHQLRAQLAAAGHPVLGDERYGDAVGRAEGLAAELGLERLFLHAASLRIPHPAGDDTLTLEAPLPPTLDAVVRSRGWDPAGPLA